MKRFPCSILIAIVSAAPTWGQLFVSEVMYDPLSNEDRWEWIELHNTGPVAIDLDRFVIDRVGDRERTTVLPNIVSQPLVGERSVANPTVVPAGGIAVLYNGPALGYDPERFRSAWPGMPAGTTLIGVEGWTSNQLSNRPTTSDYAPSLPAMTVGLWPDEASYRLDTADFGSPGAPNRRVFRTDSAAAAFGYDDNAPWRDTLGHSSLIYLGGETLAPTSWGRSNAPFGGASESRLTHQPEATNSADYGSPGVAPPGSASTVGLIVTELMINPASTTGANNEWEWIELLNTGPAIDFAQTPHWLDDDDKPALSEANLTSGQIATGATAVLFNATAASVDDMRAAWDRPGEPPIHWIAVEAWPALANGGDLIGLWDNAHDYNADLGVEGGSLARAIAGVAYDDSAPWPTGVDGDAIRLANLGSDPIDPAAWARARGEGADPDAYRSAGVLAPGGEVDNAGGDQGSPGFVWPDITSPLPGDYNRDGAVNAADYTTWRDGHALPTETATAGVNDAADYAVWSASYHAHATGQGGPTTAVPEPSATLLLLTAAARTAARDTHRPERRQPPSRGRQPPDPPNPAPIHPSS